MKLYKEDAQPVNKNRITDYDKEFRCDLCFEVKSKEEIHSNGVDADIDPNTGKIIHPEPCTLWWCNACHNKPNER